MIADGEKPTEEQWQSLPLNRADLRQRFYRNLPRAIRRDVFGRWRRVRYVDPDWIEYRKAPDRGSVGSSP